MKRRILAGMLAGVLILTQALPYYASEDELLSDDLALTVFEEETHSAAEAKNAADLPVSSDFPVIEADEETAEDVLSGTDGAIKVDLQEDSLVSQTDLQIDDFLDDSLMEEISAEQNVDELRQEEEGTSAPFDQVEPSSDTMLPDEGEKNEPETVTEAAPQNETDPGSLTVVSSDMETAANLADEDEAGHWIDFREKGSAYVYSDGSRVFPLNLDDLSGENYTLSATAGVWRGDMFVQTFTEGDGWSLDRANGQLVLDGAVLWEKGLDRIEVRVVAQVDGVEIASCQMGFDVRETWEENWFNFGDRSLLRGWTDFVDREQGCYVENSQYPDGREFRLDVTGVSATDQDGTQVVSVSEREDGWELRAENHGVAEVTVNYIAWDGTAQTEAYHLYVGNDVYDAWFDPDNGSWKLLPGKTVSLTAGASHQIEDPLTHEQRSLSDEEMGGISYVWTLDEGSFPQEWAGLITLQPDGKKAQLSVSGLPQDWDKDQGFGVRVELAVYDTTGEGGASEEQFRTDRWFNVGGSYAEIWLRDENGGASATLRSDLEAGESVTVIPELRYYDCENPDEYTVSETIHSVWYYDRNCVTVTDEDGNPVGNDDEHGNYIDSEKSTGKDRKFVITRKREWGTNIRLEAEVPEEGEMRHVDDREYHLDNRSYDIWFDFEGSDCVYAGGSRDFHINLDQVRGTGLEVRAKAGVWDHANHTFTSYVEEGSGWSLNRENGTLQIDGSTIAAKGIDRLEVWIGVFAGEEAVEEEQRGFAIREAEYQYEESYENLLPGDERFIAADDGMQRLRVCDALFPEEQWQRYRVIGISGISEEDPYDARDVLTIEETAGGYRLLAVRPGRMEMTFTLEIFHEDGRRETAAVKGSWEVGFFRAGIDLRSDNGSYDFQPGHELSLTPYIWAEEQDGESGERRNLDMSGCRVEYDVWCEWIDEESLPGEWQSDLEAATARGRFWDYEIAQDGRGLRLIAKEDAPDLNLHVRAGLMYPFEDGLLEAASTDRNYNVSSMHYEIELSEPWDKALPPGGTVTVSPVVKCYDREHPDGYVVSEEINWEAGWYEGDGDVNGDDIPHILVTDADGRTLSHGQDGGTFGKAPFTIQRVAPWDFTFSLTASWDTPGGGFQVIGRDFQMDQADYRPRFISSSGRGNRWNTFFYETEDAQVDIDLTGLKQLQAAGYPVSIEMECGYGYDENGVIRPLKTWEIDEDGRRIRETGEFSFAADELSLEGGLSIAAGDRYREIDRMLHYQEDDWGWGDPRMLLRVRASLNGISLADERFEVRLFEAYREMEDDYLTIVRGKKFHYDEGRAWLYVEDPAHSSGNDRDDRPGTYFDVTIKNIESSDPAVLLPQQEGGNWYIYAVPDAPGRGADITYTFTGGPAGAAEETHTTTLFLSDTWHWVESVNAEGGYQDHYDLLPGESGQVRIRVTRETFTGAEKNSFDEVDLSHVSFHYWDWDDRVISLDEATGRFTALRTGDTQLKIGADIWSGTPEASEHLQYAEVTVRIHVGLVRTELVLPEGAALWAASGAAFTAAAAAAKLSPVLKVYSTKHPEGEAKPVTEYVFDGADEGISLSSPLEEGKYQKMTVASNVPGETGADGAKTVRVGLLAKSAEGFDAGFWFDVKVHTHKYGSWVVTRKATSTVREQKTRTCTCGNCGHSENMVKPAIKLSAAAVSMTRTKAAPTPSKTVTVTLDAGDAIASIGNTNSKLVTASFSGTKITVKAVGKTALGSAKLTVYTKKEKTYGSITGSRVITVTITESLSSPASGTLSVTGLKTKAYTGKALTQAPVVKVGTKKLTLNKDYTLAYKNNKNVGKATVTIKGKGNYTSSVSKTFTINPKTTWVKKLTAGTNQFKVVWDKRTVQTTGYQIQYSTSSTFRSGNVTKTVSNTKTTSLTVTKLKAKKLYYVRVRTYRKVSGKTYYSAWSAVKKIKTK